MVSNGGLDGGDAQSVVISFSFSFSFSFNFLFNFFLCIFFLFFSFLFLFFFFLLCFGPPFLFSFCLLFSLSLMIHALTIICHSLLVSFVSGFGFGRCQSRFG